MDILDPALTARYNKKVPPNPEIKDSNFESVNPGFRDSRLTSPMTCLLTMDLIVLINNHC